MKNSEPNHSGQLKLLYRTLFVVFTEFMDTEYNGVIRTLLKLFIISIEEVIRDIVILKEKQGEGYLIAIFENYIIDKPIIRD
jgi:hypothetical protein